MESTTFLQQLETATRSQADTAGAPDLRVPGLTILAHPDLSRIGERVVLLALASGGEAALSRLEPRFAAPGDARRRPLADPYLSRRPLSLVATADGGIRLRSPSSKIRVTADGIDVREGRELAPAAIERGVVLLLAERVALLLHRLEPLPPAAVPSFGLVGENAGLVVVRHHISRLADLDVPVLIRGETGTGKELVATAIHTASRRRGGPLVVVNTGAIPPELAAAELFGAAKGAYTGADRRRGGFFTRAAGGTLFLDEIGETPVEVQVMLLRVLETGMVQAIGDEAPRKVDVRIVAATDTRLETAIAAGRFRAPLLHRLSGFEIRLPPLRERRDDLGRLLLHFLSEEIAGLEAPRDLDAGDEARPWLPAPLVARLAHYDWPGNVRQLRNVARQLRIASRGEPQLRASAEVEALLDEAAPATSPALATPDAAVTEPGSPVDLTMAERATVATLLLTDLVDSTGLVERLGDARALKVLSRHDREARRLLGEYAGREIDKADGFLLLFDRPTDAVGYALEYHHLLSQLSLELGLELQARAGIHLGELHVRCNDPEDVARGAKPLEVEGLAKPTAARLMALAGGGQTLLSRTAFELARQSARGEHPLAAPAVRWLAHGRYFLPGLEEPVEVFEAGVEGSAPLEAPAGATEVRREPDASTPPAETPATVSYRSPAEVSEEELLVVLRAHGFRLQPTAAALGISRTSLYALVDRSARIRKARDLGQSEIERSRLRHGGDLDAMAAELEVSRKGLRRRMTELGFN